MKHPTDEEIEKAAIQDNHEWSDGINVFVRGAKWARDQQPKWIDVNEELPSIHDQSFYLVNDGGSYAIACITGLRSNLTNLPIWQDSKGYFIHSVTHYQPLPFLP